jgi:hypothetical protein
MPGRKAPATGGDGSRPIDYSQLLAAVQRAADPDRRERWWYQDMRLTTSFSCYRCPVNDGAVPLVVMSDVKARRWV